MITQLNFVEQLEYCCNLNETVNASKLMLHFTLYTGMPLFHRILKRFNDYPDRFCSSEIECSARIIISGERSSWNYDCPLHVKVICAFET